MFFFFQFPCKVKVLILLFTFFQFYSASLQFCKFSFFLLIIGQVFWPTLGDPFVCQSSIGVSVSFTRTDAESCIYQLFVWSNFNFLCNFQWISFLTQSCLVLYSFVLNCCIRLLCDWSFRLSPHNLRLLFCSLSIYSIFVMIGSYGVVLCCYKERLTFLSHIQVFSRVMFLISRLKHRKNCFSTHFCHSVGLRVVSIVSDVCNQFSFMHSM